MEILVPNTLPGDSKVVVFSLSQDEEAALLAAGRAAGCTDLKSVIYGVLDDAIGIGCSVMRAEEETREEIISTSAQLHTLIEEIANSDSPGFTFGPHSPEFTGLDAVLLYSLENAMKENMHRGTRRLKDAISLGDKLRRLTKKKLSDELECTLTAYAKSAEFNHCFNEY
jgi:hypothetical protein